jgi:hypothetical protein
MTGGATPATVRLANTLSDGARARRTVLALVCAAIALSLLVVRAWRIDYDYSIDFQAYWLAGQRILAGEAADLYTAGGGPEAGTPRVLPAAEFKNLPVVALPFAPLATADYLTAKRLFWWSGLAALIGTAAILGTTVVPQRLGGTLARSAAALALVCVLAPAHTALRHGQTTPLVALAVSGYLAASLGGRRVVAGLLLAAAGAVKWPAWILAAADALRRRWRLVTAFAASIFALVLTSVTLFGVALHREYVAEIGSHAGAVMTGHNNQSVAAVLTRLTSPVPVNDWTPRPMTGEVRALALVVSLVLLATVIAFLLPRRSGNGVDGRTRQLLEFAAVTALAIIILPVAWDHYFLLLAPGLAALAAGLHARGLLARPAFLAGWITATAAIGLPTPQYFLDRAGEIGWPGALILSHYFLGALLVIAVAGSGLRVAARPGGEVKGGVPQ